MDEKAQGAFEYILMLAGMLLVVIVVVLILRSQVSGAGTGINTSRIQFNSTVFCNVVTNSTTNCCWEAGKGCVLA